MSDAYYDTHYLFKLQCIKSGTAEVRAHAATVQVLYSAIHARAEFTAAGGDVIESDKGFEMLMQTVPTEVKDNLAVTHTREFNLAKARFSKELKQRLENVPGHRRPILEERLTRFMQRAYQEGGKIERIEPLAKAPATTEQQMHIALKTHKRDLMQQLFPSPEENEG